MGVEAELLADMRIFAGLPREALAELAGRGTTPRVRRRPGHRGPRATKESPSSSSSRARSGSSRAARRGRQQTLATLGPSESLFVVPAYSAPHTSPASAIAVGKARLLRIAQDDFRRIAVRNPQVATALLRDLSDKLRRLTGLTHDLSLRSIRGRLARFLLQEGPDAGSLTQEQMAARLGTVREVVSRTLQAFVREGLIRKEGPPARIVDATALRSEIDDSLR